MNEPLLEAEYKLWSDECSADRTGLLPGVLMLCRGPPRTR